MKNMTLPKTIVPKLTPDSTEGNRTALGFRFQTLLYLQGRVTCTTLIQNTRSKSRKGSRGEMWYHLDPFLQKEKPNPKTPTPDLLLAKDNLLFYQQLRSDCL